MSPVARLLALLVRAYQQLVSPLLPPRCRFAPTCSCYALEALQVHGAGRGSWLALRRVARCHPFHPGGHDPVPPAVPSTVPPKRTVPAHVGDDAGGSMSFGAAPRRPAPRLGALS